MIKYLVSNERKDIISPQFPSAAKSIYWEALSVFNNLSKYLQNCHTTPAPDNAGSDNDGSDNSGSGNGEAGNTDQGGNEAKSNKLFESEEERMEFIKQYNNNVLRFITGEDYKTLQTPTFNKSIEHMVTDWGVNNKVWSQKEVENGRINGLVERIQETVNSYCADDLKRAFILDEYTKKATFEQGTKLEDEFYLLTRNGEVVVRKAEDLLKLKK